MNQTTFGNEKEEESAESDQNSDIIVLNGEGSREEQQIRNRSKGLNLQKDDQEIEVL